MKKILIAILLNAFCIVASAQQFYRFSNYTEAYTELKNATFIDTMKFAEQGFYPLPVNGETFNFFGVDFPFGGVKTFHLQSNGNLRIDNDSALIIIDGAFTYLDSIDANSSVSYVVEGPSGNKIVKVQWKNLKVRAGKPGNFMNVQIWVYQSTGVVELRYGPSDETNRSGFNTTSGPQVGMFFSRDDFSKQYEKIWITGSPDAIKVDSARNYVFKAMSGIPTEGTVFRFAPKTLSIKKNDKPGSSSGFYPNPARNSIRLKNITPGAQLYINDASGRLFITKQVSDSN